MSLKDGLKALQQRHYSEAVEWLEAYCQTASNSYSQEYAQAQMALARAYDGNGEKNKAIALCQQLEQHLDSQVSNWAKGFLSTLTKAQTKPEETITDIQKPRAKAGRANRTEVRLVPIGVTDNLTLATAATIVLLVGIVAVLYLALLFIRGEAPLSKLTEAIIVSLVFNAAVFFLSPSIMDKIQEAIYQTRWVTLAEIEKRSPEAAEVIKRVCQQKNLNWPRLGIIEDRHPTAFTYGLFPDQARIVISQGLFAYLDDDEIATVYAHELGHIIHWEFAMMTAASTLIQIAYLISTFVKDFSRRVGNEISKNAIAAIAIIPYAFYLVGIYLVSYLSRTREYYADCFAAETTGNPNGLSRALVKIAYGLLEEGTRDREPSKAIEGTRTLSIYDPGAAIVVGTAYRVASDPQKIGQVLLWDMFNPWGWWMELNSTHPLTGKRLRILTTYAEQMGLDTEFALAAAIREGKKLSKNKLYGNLILDILLYNAQWVGTIIGFILGLLFIIVFSQQGILPSLTFFGFGIGTLVYISAMYRDRRRIPQTDILTLMCDPYVSPLGGYPVQLQGQVIGHGDAGYQFAGDLKLQDRTGTIYIRSASRFGFLGDFLFSATRAQRLIGSEVKAVGWFRREIFPRVDLVQLKTVRTPVQSYPRFWLLIIGIGAIIFGFVAPMLISY
jgi:Zn-dependent protease with chaperone function